MSETAVGEGRARLYGPCRQVLECEGFVIRRTEKPRRPSLPNFVAMNRAHTVNVFIVPDHKIDAERTRSRIAASVRRAETRVFVSWRLRWWMTSNLERWGIGGVAVDVVDRRGPYSLGDTVTAFAKARNASSTFSPVLADVFMVWTPNGPKAASTSASLTAMRSERSSLFPIATTGMVPTV